MTTTNMSQPKIAQNWPSLVAFLLACFLVFLFGGLFQPGDWYATLNKAPWTPPNIAFPIVWVALYICIAIAGWLIFHHGNKTLKALWCIQLILNGLWSWVFFGQHWVALGLINIVLIDAVVINLILKAKRAKLTGVTLLLLPYIGWLLLASTLNTYILLTN